MKNLGIQFRARVGDHIDRGRVALVGQVSAIEKDRESVGPSKSRTETKQHITIRKERVRLINWITREVTLQVRAGVETRRALVIGKAIALHKREPGFPGGDCRRQQRSDRSGNR